MSDSITQMRLAARMDAYLEEYTGKHISQDHAPLAEWNLMWQAATLARTQRTLTPELVDDVRIALKKL